MKRLYLLKIKGVGFRVQVTFTSVGTPAPSY